MRINKNMRPWDLERHDRCCKGAVVRTGTDGMPEIVARIWAVYPRDGVGTLWVGLSDYRTGGDSKHYLHSASGWGYDKFTAVLTGMSCGGVELGDHCDRANRPTLQDLCQREGWLLLMP